MNYLGNISHLLLFVCSTLTLIIFNSFSGCASTLQENNGSMVVDILDSNSIPSYEPRFDRARPVIAVVGVNSFTELTDFVVPFGILSEADVADVFAYQQ